MKTTFRDVVNVKFLTQRLKLSLFIHLYLCNYLCISLPSFISCTYQGNWKTEKLKNNGRSYTEVWAEIFVSEIRIKEKQNRELKGFKWDMYVSESCRLAMSKVDLFIQQESVQ